MDSYLYNADLYSNQLWRLLLESSQRSIWANLDSWNFKGLPYSFESGIGSCLRYEFFKIYGGYIFVELDLLRASLSTWVVCEIGMLPLRFKLLRFDQIHKTLFINLLLMKPNHLILINESTDKANLIFYMSEVTVTA